MQTFSHFLAADHHRCDELFAAAEAAVEGGEWTAARSAHQGFVDAMRHHFAMEEELLFPAFEEASGNSMGPTAVMRHEHQQMQGLFAEMGQAMAQQNRDDYLGHAETLLILMQQHNAKEEQVLYPMTDQVLASQQEALLQRMRSMVEV
jgi:hemerythrin-like domain-containing protein